MRFGNLTSSQFDFAALAREPSGDALAMIALDFDDAVLGRSAGAAVAFERARNLLDLCRRKSCDDAHRASAAALAKDTDDAIVGNAPLRSHQREFGRLGSIDCTTARA